MADQNLIPQVIAAWMGRVFDATGWSGDDWAGKANLSGTTITRFYDVRNRRTKTGAALPTGNTLARLERAAPFTIATSNAADGPGGAVVQHGKPVDDDLMLRAIQEVLTYIIEERLDFEPIDTANQIMHLYHQYAEKEEALAREPTVIIAGNVFRPQAWRRPGA